MVLACATLVKTADSLETANFSCLVKRRALLTQRSGRNIDHGARRRSGWSGSKYDGGIKDDHNWGGPSPKARNKSWPGYALVLSLSHSCPAIAEWARSQSGFGSSPFSLEKCDRWMMLEPQPNSSAGWATHKTVARGPSSRVGHSSYKLNVL